MNAALPVAVGQPIADSPLARSVGSAVPPRSLVARLGEVLQDHRIPHVQWKGNWKRTRWMSGEGDIDLLVDRAAEAPFRTVLGELGFHRADSAPEHGTPGIESHFGFDPFTGRLIHVHVHFRLVVGSPWRVVYHLPIETPLLQSAVQGDVFPVPAAEFELIAFAVRMVQRYSALDVLRRHQPVWLNGIQAELDALVAKADRAKLTYVFTAHLPSLDLPFLEACLASFRRGYPRWHRVLLRRELHRRMRAHARRPPLHLTLSRWGRWLVTVGGWIPSGPAKKYLAHGGTVVALVGGDGAGKSTCTRELGAWSSGALATMTAHLGRPPRSLLTLVVGALFKVGRAIGVCAASDQERGRGPGYLAALRDLCTARDRYRLYVKARRFALAGGIALCERYPVLQVPQFSGPRLRAFAEPLGRTRLGRWLMATESRYYSRMFRPDLLIVLQVDPEVAVQRKTDEPAEYVRKRCSLVWDVDWSGTGAHVIDAGRSLPVVLADLKTILWREL